MFETLTNLNLIKLLTTTDQLSIKHTSGNDKLAADVEEAVKELVEDYSILALQYIELKDELLESERQAQMLEALTINKSNEIEKLISRIEYLEFMETLV